MALDHIIELLQDGGMDNALIDLAIAFFQILQWFIDLITVVGIF